MSESITDQDVYKIIRNLIKFPFSQICVHKVACDLLSLLEDKKYSINPELAKAIVFANDDISIKILDDLLKT